MCAGWTQGETFRWEQHLRRLVSMNATLAQIIHWLGLPHPRSDLNPGIGNDYTKGGSGANPV